MYDGIYGAATTRGAPGALGPDGGNAIRQVQLGGGGGVTMGDLFGLANGSPMSFEFLFCPSSVPQVQNMGVPELFGGGNSSFPYLLAYDRTGATAAPQVVLEIPSQNVYDRVASPPYGSWMHMVVTFDGTNARMYENSMEVGLTGFAPDAGDAAARTFSVGVDSDGFNEFSGSIDEFAVYGTVLPAETIDAHYELVLAVQGDAGCGVVDAGTAHDL